MLLAIINQWLQRRLVFVVIFSRFLKIDFLFALMLLFVTLRVDVENIFHLFSLLTASGNLF